MFDAPFDTAEIMQKSRKVLVDGVPIYVPSGSHLLVSAFYHSQISDVHALTNSDNYRALMDVSRILASDNAAIDWEFIEGRVDERRYLAKFKFFMQRATALYGGELPEFLAQGKGGDFLQIWPRTRNHRGRNIIASTIDHLRELHRALSSSGRKERRQLLVANPDNWKYEPVYKQMLSPAILRKRLKYYMDE